MWNRIRSPLAAFVLLSLLTGLVYPLVMTGLAQAIMPFQANGSLIVRNGRVIGSELIGQPFDSPQYFRGRPSATTPPYNGGASAGSNLGPTNPVLMSRIAERVRRLQHSRDQLRGRVPVDLVTASASGLDPHISPAAARYQVEDVARSRHLPVEIVQGCVERATENRTFGLLGELRVNVLRLNLELDRETRAAPDSGNPRN